jgi:hypothetical protein
MFSGRHYYIFIKKKEYVVSLYFLLRRVLGALGATPFLRVFFAFLQKVRLGPDATLHPLTFLHLLGFFTLFLRQRDADMLYYISRQKRNM